MSEGGHGSLRVILLALAANLGIAVAKFIGAFFSGSASLFAEAIHSVVDSTNQVLLIVGNRAAAQPADEHYPLGHGREAFFWSFVVAILLFSLGGLFAIYEGFHKLSGHEEVSMPWLGFVILIVSICLEGGSFRACLKEVEKSRDGKSLWHWFKTTTSADLLVIFTEDAAALVGLVAALVFFTMTVVTKNPVWDAAGSIFIGAVLVVVAIFLAIEIKSLMIGEAPSKDYRTEIGRIAGEVIEGCQVIRMIALQTGSHEVMVSMKVTPGTIKEALELINRINEIERLTKLRFPEIRWLFTEPDLWD